jgi:hypothetical protein
MDVESTADSEAKFGGDFAEQSQQKNPGPIYIRLFSPCALDDAQITLLRSRKCSTGPAAVLQLARAALSNREIHVLYEKLFVKIYEGGCPSEWS